MDSCFSRVFVLLRSQTQGHKRTLNNTLFTLTSPSPLFIYIFTSLTFQKSWRSLKLKSHFHFFTILEFPFSTDQSAIWPGTACHTKSTMEKPSLALQEMISKVEHVQRLLLHHRLQLHLCQQPLLYHNTLTGQFSCLSVDCFVLFTSFTSVSLHRLMENLVIFCTKKRQKKWKI